METPWHPFVHESLVEITSAARGRILNSLRVLQAEARRNGGVLSICYARFGRRHDSDGATVSELKAHVLIGVHDREYVPADMTFVLMGFEVAYALNPVFGASQKRVVVDCFDTHLVAKYDDP